MSLRDRLSSSRGKRHCSDVQSKALKVARELGVFGALVEAVANAGVAAAESCTFDDIEPKGSNAFLWLLAIIFLVFVFGFAFGRISFRLRLTPSTSDAFAQTEVAQTETVGTMSLCTCKWKLSTPRFVYIEG